MCVLETNKMFGKDTLLSVNKQHCEERAFDYAWLLRITQGDLIFFSDLCDHDSTLILSLP
jgi:hypothetical protein